MKKYLIEKILKPIEAAGFKAYFVGGCVRDEIMGKEPHDFDICTNATLNSLAACVYVAYLGSQGIKELAETNISKARYAFDKIKNIKGFVPLFENPFFFNEFVFKTDKNTDNINEELLKENILGPLDLEKINPEYKNCIMFAVTEKRSRQEIDKLTEILTRV